MKRALLAWGSVVLPLWAVFIYCAYWEPVQNDGWTHIYWYKWHTLSLGSAWEFVRHSYLTENPRIGQLFTLLLHSRAPVQVIVTPILDLVVFALATALALGRLPSLRRADDALAFATLTAIVATITAQFGSLMFYRPFVGNYTVGLALDLAWLLPFRLLPRPRLWLAPVMLAIGFIAGMCNEHTGLALLAIALGVIVVRWRRGERPAAWMIAAIVGLAAGYILLLVAPGQNLRYSALATKAGVLERIIDRGAWENAHVVLYLLLNVARALPWLALGAIAHVRLQPPALAPAQRASIVVAALAALAITLTLLASPLIGPRLYFASCVAAAIAITGWLVTQLVATRARVACAVLAIAALAYTSWAFIAWYRVYGPIGAERYDKIWTSTPGTIVEVPRNPLHSNRLFAGDDFEKERVEATRGDYQLQQLIVK
jgi:hypothetical protein